MLTTGFISENSEHRKIQKTRFISEKNSEHRKIQKTRFINEKNSEYRKIQKTRFINEKNSEHRKIQKTRFINENNSEHRKILVHSAKSEILIGYRLPVICQQVTQLTYIFWRISLKFGVREQLKFHGKSMVQ